MKVFIHNSKFNILGETREEISILWNLCKRYKYNDGEYFYNRVLKSRGEKPKKVNWGDRDELLDRILVSKDLPAYQNYLCLKHNELTGRKHKNYNFIKKVSFNASKWRECNNSTVYKAKVGKTNRTTLLPLGYLDDAITFLSKHYDLEKIDYFDKSNRHGREALMSMTDEPIYSLPNGVTLRDYQKRDLDILRSQIKADPDKIYQRLGSLLTMNYGKSYLSAVILQNFKVPAVSFFKRQNLAIKAIIEAIEFGIHPNVVISDQTRRTLNKELRAKGLPLDYTEHIGGTYCIAMLPTVASLIRKGRMELVIFNYYKLILLDEVDELTSKEFYKLIEQLSGLFVSMTGTMDNHKSGEKRFMIRGITGRPRL